MAHFVGCASTHRRLASEKASRPAQTCISPSPTRPAMVAVNGALMGIACRRPPPCIQRSPKPRCPLVLFKRQSGGKHSNRFSKRAGPLALCGLGQKLRGEFLKRRWQSDAGCAGWGDRNCRKLHGCPPEFPELEVFDFICRTQQTPAKRIRVRLCGAVGRRPLRY